jgi:ribosomal protein S18 acetylase RimI-like enzyme
VIAVEAAAVVDDDLCAAVNRLVSQLSRSSAPPSRSVLERMVADDGTTLFVARGDDGIVGMLTLATFQIPTGVRAWIEDVVVDETARGTGVAVALVQAALDRSAALGARTVDLTSRPHREAANRLYLRMGFEVRQTNVYRVTLEDPG